MCTCGWICSVTSVLEMFSKCYLYFQFSSPLIVDFNMKKLRFLITYVGNQPWNAEELVYIEGLGSNITYYKELKVL